MVCVLMLSLCCKCWGFVACLFRYWFVVFSFLPIVCFIVLVYSVYCGGVRVVLFALFVYSFVVEVCLAFGICTAALTLVYSILVFFLSSLMF